MTFFELMQAVRKDPLDVTVPARWAQGRASFGGLVAALAYGAMRDKAQPGRPVRSLAITFVGPMEAEVPARFEAEVLREGKEVTLPVEIGLLQEATPAAAESRGGEDTPAAPREESGFGLRVALIDDDLRARFNLEPEATGIVIVDVDSSSDGWDKGLRPGDVVAEVGQEPVASPRDFLRRIEAAEQSGRRSVLMLVRRDGAPRFVAVALGG